jgi:ubiquinone/menaquinone biosynthesis C-methylase UbiE
MKGYRRDPEQVQTRVLRRLIPLEGARVLDVGCGDGRMTWKIAGTARSVVAIDPNERLLAEARRSTPRQLRRKIQYRTGTAERPNLSGARFSVALFSGSL